MEKAGGLTSLLFTMFMESQTLLSQLSLHLMPAVIYKGVVVCKQCRCFGPMHCFRYEVTVKTGICERNHLFYLFANLHISFLDQLEHMGNSFACEMDPA